MSPRISIGPEAVLAAHIPSPPAAGSHCPAREDFTISNPHCGTEFLLSLPFLAPPHACTAFGRLRFLQAHRETEMHFAATGMPSQHNNSDMFVFRRAAFYQTLKI
jgi:hypothetical protein